MTTYYISTTGNDSNPGTVNQPFKTISKGISVSTNGDTVHVNAGTYYPTFSTRPIINKQISVIGDGKTNTIIDGTNITGWVSPGDWKKGLVEITANNVLFSGFTVQNVLPSSNGYGAAGITIYPVGSAIQNVIVEKNYVYNIWGTGIQAYGSSQTVTASFIIRYNDIDHACNGGDPAIIREETLSVGNFIDGFEIYYNHIHTSGYTPSGNIHYGAEGIDVKDGAKNGKIHHNYVYDTHSVGIYLDSYSQYCTNVEVYNNIVEKTYGFSNYSAPGTGIALSNEAGGYTIGHNIHDNIMYDHVSGFLIYGGHGSGSSYNPIGFKDIIFNNNIIYDGDIEIRNCLEILNNLRITNNYSTVIYIAPCYQSETTLSGNITDATLVANEFNARYSTLKNDILDQVGGSVLTSIQISPTNANTNVGKTVQLAAVCKDQNNNTIACPTLTWLSSDTTKATVGSSGLVTGVAAGNANITASGGGVMSNASAITVTGPVLTTIAIAPTSASITTSGTQQLSAICKDQNNNNMTCPTLTWASSNSAIASVNPSTGLVTGVSAGGPVNITASGGGVTSNISAITVAPLATNILLNSGFELSTKTVGIPDNWSKYPVAVGTYTYPEVGNDGSKAVGISQTISGHSQSWVQNITKIVPNAKYEIGGYLSTNNVVRPDNTRGAVIGIDWYDSSGAYISEKRAISLAGTNSWIYKIATITAPSNAARAHFFVGLFGIGKALFDNVLFRNANLA